MLRSTLRSKATVLPSYRRFEHGPHPDLTEGQKKVVAKDYGLEIDKTVLSVRYAMLFYVLKRLGLLDDAVKRSARTQHIVNVNRKETQAALERAEFQL